MKTLNELTDDLQSERLKARKHAASFFKWQDKAYEKGLMGVKWVEAKQRYENAGERWEASIHKIKAMEKDIENETARHTRPKKRMVARPTLLAPYPVTAPAPKPVTETAPTAPPQVMPQALPTKKLNYFRCKMGHVQVSDGSFQCHVCEV